jgi:DNA repair protein SbcC/Rad50
MITALKILNFQSHANSELTFHPGVNVIVGNSDSGKSAIIRALRWAIWNRPSGDSIRSWWGGATSCKIVLDGTSVTRYKDKVDKYTIEGKEGTKTQEFKAIGIGVPEEVNRVLNVDNINLQYQLDSPFLLSKTPGEVASHFNAVAGLSKIDTATYNVNSWIREITADIKYKEAEEEKLKGQVKEFEYLPNLEKWVLFLEEKEKKLASLTADFNTLEKLKNDIFLLDVAIKDKSEILEAEPELDKILELIEKRKQFEEKRKGLSILLFDVDLVVHKINRQSMFIKTEPDVDALLKLYAYHKIQSVAYQRLYKAIRNLKDINAYGKKKVSEIASMEVLFKKEMGETCLLCGQKIK